MWNNPVWQLVGCEEQKRSNEDDPNLELAD